jgi:hypothetical protein
MQPAASAGLASTARQVRVRVVLGAAAATLAFGAFGVARASNAALDDPPSCPGGGKECAIKDHCVKWNQAGECIEAKPSIEMMKMFET